MAKRKVLVTGSSGFVGAHVVREFISQGFEVIGINRSVKTNPHLIKNITHDTDWSDVLEGVEIIIHCAAAVHQMKSSEDVLISYEELNVLGTLNLARQASKKNVKRFIFLSTIKVNGEETFDKKFYADDTPRPTDPYGQSKARAETGLQKIARLTKMDIVIIRPPLVYGPNPKGNLNKLALNILNGLPLPFGAVDFNFRSMVYVGNLVNFITVCAEHEQAKNQIFLISDDDDMSTLILIKKVSKALGKSPKLIKIPENILRILFKLLGRQEYICRLLGNLRVDILKNKRLLDWQPKYTVDEGIKNSFSKKD